MSRLVSLPFFWIRFLDSFCHGRSAADAAGGLFFFGRRSDHEIKARAMPGYYERQSGRREPGPADKDGR